MENALAGRPTHSRSLEIAARAVGFFVAEQATDRRMKISKSQIGEQVEAVHAFPQGIAVELTVAQCGKIGDARLVWIFNKQCDDLVRPNGRAFETEVKKIAIIADVQPPEVASLSGARGNGRAGEIESLPGNIPGNVGTSRAFHHR